VSEAAQRWAQQDIKDSMDSYIHDRENDSYIDDRENEGTTYFPEYEAIIKLFSDLGFPWFEDYNKKQD
jgi:hypothetical protein